MKCSKCGHETNHKSGICIACNFDAKFNEIKMKKLSPKKLRLGKELVEKLRVKTFGVEGTPKVSPKDNLSPTSARSPFKATKSTQGTKGGTLALSPSQNNPYLLDDLELLLNAQISHIFSLVKEGKLKLAAHRINIVQKELTKNKHAK